MLLEEMRKKLEKRITNHANRPIHPVEIIGEDWSRIPNFKVREMEPIVTIIREESESAVVYSFLLSMDNYIIGYVSSIYWKRPPLIVANHCWFMESLSIKKEFRRRGYGRLLMETMHETLRGNIIFTLCRKEMIPFHTTKLGKWRLIGRCVDSRGKPISQYALVCGIDLGKLLNKRKS